MSERFYRARIVKAGPFVGVRTFFDGPLVDGEILDRSPRWQCQVGGETTARRVLMGDELPIEIDGKITLRNLESVSEADYRYLVAHAAYAVAHAPHLPDAAPRTKVNKRGDFVW